MEISKRTIEVLKNFSSINQSIYYNPEMHGSNLITKAVASNIIASAEIEETFPEEFAIYNINEFLSTLPVFDKPDLVFENKFVTIREAGSKRGGLKYYYSSPALIVYPKKKPSAPPANFTFGLTAEHIQKIDKSAKILNVEDLILYGDDDGIHAIVTNKKNVTSNDFEITLSNESVGNFNYLFKQTYWKFLTGDYKVSISTKETDGVVSGIGFFESVDGTIKYGVSMERQGGTVTRD